MADRSSTSVTDSAKWNDPDLALKMLRIPGGDVILSGDDRLCATSVATPDYSNRGAMPSHSAGPCYSYLFLWGLRVIGRPLS